MSRFVFYTPEEVEEMDRSAQDRAIRTMHIVSPGDVISHDPGVMRGHGTLPHASSLYSTLSGPVTRTNALMTVTSPNARYVGEIGDVVIGRIRTIQTKSWKVEMNSKQDAILMLSAIILPGGVQRRKQESDQIMMHTFLKEGDLIAAEVQQFQNDGSASLHTRNLKFGKLRSGCLVEVSPSLILRSKSQFHTLPFGVDITFGLNGYIWISVAKPRSEDIQLQRLEVTEADSLKMYSDENEKTNDTNRALLARACNLIRALASHHLHISDVTVNLAWESSLDYEISALLDPKIISIVGKRTRMRLDENAH